MSLQRALTAYGYPSVTRTETVSGGLINQTYLVRDAAGKPDGILQRLHRVFAPEVNLDIERITSFVADAGLRTPLLKRTHDGQAWFADEGYCWRMLTYVEGVSFHRAENLDQVTSAGALVGRFHRCLASVEYDFVFNRAGVHDTESHLRRLREGFGGGAQPEAVVADACRLASEILRAAGDIADFRGLPRRICHGDLKLSNLLFAAADTNRALCLVDLDTMGKQPMAFELGDALRSWCNPISEDAGTAEFDLDTLRSAIQGYADGSAGLLGKEEVNSLIPGLQTVCVELAARFCVDVFDDRYFGWDPARFASRREHNLVRAQGQLDLARDVARNAANARQILGDIWGYTA